MGRKNDRSVVWCDNLRFRASFVNNSFGGYAFGKHLPVFRYDRSPDWSRQRTFGFCKPAALSLFFMSSCSFVLITCGVFAVLILPVVSKPQVFLPLPVFAGKFFLSLQFIKQIPQVFALEERFSANFCVSAPFVSNTLRIPAFSSSAFSFLPVAFPAVPVFSSFPRQFLRLFLLLVNAVQICFEF